MAVPTDAGSVMLFPPEPPAPVADAEVEAVLCSAMCSPYAGRLPRSAELLLAELCARHLMDQLSLAGMRVMWIWPEQQRKR